MNAKTNRHKSASKPVFWNARRRNIRAGYGFIMPWIIGFFVFTLFPVVYSILLSLNAVTLLPGSIQLDWKGLYYYTYAFNVDTKFKLNLGNALMMIGCSLPIVLVFSLILALLLNRKYPGRTLFRTIFFLPVIIMSGPAISKLLSSYNINLSETIPSIMGVISSFPDIISEPVTYVLDNFVLILWFSGVQILVFLAGLQKISPQLYEAADIDGAGAWEKFWKITLPHLAPIAIVCAVYTVIEIANYSNLSINQQIVEQLMDTKHVYSFSAAMSWVYFVVILLLLGVVYLLFRLLGRRSRG